MIRQNSKWFLWCVCVCVFIYPVLVCTYFCRHVLYLYIYKRSPFQDMVVKSFLRSTNPLSYSLLTFNSVLNFTLVFFLFRGNNIDYKQKRIFLLPSNFYTFVYKHIVRLKKFLLNVEMLDLK